MSSVTQRPVKVLLVEYDPDGKGGLCALLERAPGIRFDVEQVGELSDGLERLSHDGVDVVVLDLFLPDSEGAATFERAHAFAPHVPIVVVTQHEREGLGVTTVQGGAQDYLVREDIGAAGLARSIRYAIERHRLLSALRSLSLIDELTGLYNQRGFHQLGEQYLKLARRSGRGGALLYADIDRFRTINEGLGHHVGDRALLRLADILRSTVRSSDLMARLGSDEFAVLALESTAETSDGLVRRIRASIDEFNGRSRQPYRLDVSIGVAPFGPEGAPGLDELLEASAEQMQDDRHGKGTPT